MITPDELAAYGRQLNADGATEIVLRTAVGRMYYSAFHRCRQFAQELCSDLQPDEKAGKGEHAQVFARLSEHSRRKEFDGLLSTLAEDAKKMWKLRVRADYKLEQDFPRADVLRCDGLLKAAETTCTEIERQKSAAPAATGA